jgi:Reverse transcriptase (RNA-dependent DNA polymerase)
MVSETLGFVDCIRAIKGPDVSLWREAIDNEYSFLIKNDCFEVVPRASHKTLPTRWILTTKIQPNGCLRKARFIVQGHHQIPGKDFMETFAPTLCKESLRFVIALKKLRHMASRQLDVNCAFLNGKIDRTIYIELPQVVYSDAERQDKIGLLRRSLYGLKQSPMLWNAHLAKQYRAWRLKSHRQTHVFISRRGKHS